MSRPRVLCVTGPTASGKSELALRAALAVGGEIVCMDSMQVYRGMDVGTSKPTRGERDRVTHHLLDVADPAGPYSVAQYARDAEAAVRGVLNRGRLPVLCGGTGLYLRALSGGMDFGFAPSDPAVRAAWQDLASRQGPDALHALLMERDPESARRLHPNDLRRVIRALEVLELTGRPFSAQRGAGAQEGPWDLRVFALHWPREALYARINARVERMLREGLAEEVRSLLDRVVSPDAQSMQGLGYKEMIPCLRGECDLEQAKETISRRTRNYAKRQLTWFRADERVRWMEGAAGAEGCLPAVLRALEED